MLSSESFTTDAACWFLQLVGQCVDCGCFCNVTNCTSKLLVDCVLVGIVGSDGLNALAVTPVLLAVEGILPLRTPIRRLFFALLDVFFSKRSYFYPRGCMAA